MQAYAHGSAVREHSQMLRQRIQRRHFLCEANFLELADLLAVAVQFRDLHPSQRAANVLGHLWHR